MIKAPSFRILLAGLVSVGSVFFSDLAQAQNPGAQTTSEVGLGIGGLVYKGELAPYYQFRNNRPALTAFYRRDLSGAITARAALTGGMLRADDRNVRGLNGNQLPLAAYRDANLKGGLLELSGGIEYNFFDYHNREDKVHFTPYVFVGLAGFYANTEVQSKAFPSLDKKGNVLGVAVPVGVGFKYALSTHWNLGLEVGARKTFTDDLDHIDGKSHEKADVLGNPHDQDWYFYNGLSVSYTFYKIHCPDKRDDKVKKK